MGTLNTLLNAYIDVNITLMAVCLVWMALAFGLRCMGLGHAATAPLRLLRTGFLLALISPLLMGVLAKLIGPAPGVNLSDFVLSQYLQGRFAVSPTTLETALGLRAQFVEAVLAPSDWLAYALLSGLTVGVALFALRFIASLWSLRQVVATSFLWRSFGGLELRLSDSVSVPFSARLLRRRIVVLPSAILTQGDDLKIALGHELQHHRQHDVEWELGLELLRPIFFWNPFFYLWKRQVERLRELSCDRQVLLRHRFDVAAYCDCLIRACDTSLRKRRMFAAPPPGVGLVQLDRRLFGVRSAHLLRQRMLALIDGRPEAHPNRLLAALMVPLLALTALAVLVIQNRAIGARIASCCPPSSILSGLQ